MNMLSMILGICILLFTIVSAAHWSFLKHLKEQTASDDAVFHLDVGKAVVIVSTPVAVAGIVMGAYDVSLTATVIYVFVSFVVFVICSFWILATRDFISQATQSDKQTDKPPHTDATR